MPILNVSRLSDHLRCEVYEHNRWRLQRAPLFDGSGALGFGLAWHAAMEVLFKRGTLEAALAVAEVEFDKAKAEARNEAQAQKIEEGRTVLPRLLPHVTIPSTWKILHVEQELRLPMAPLPTSGEALEFRGRPDALVVWEGRIWHVQHKTAGTSVSWPMYERAIQRSFHENLYIEMLERLAPDLFDLSALGVNQRDPIGGTLLLGVRRLSPRQASMEPTTAFHRAYIPNNPSDRARAIQTLMRLADRVHNGDTIHALGIPVGPVENRDACFGTFKNSPCPYVDACDGRHRLDDPAYFTDRNPLASYTGETSDA